MIQKTYALHVDFANGITHEPIKLVQGDNSRVLDQFGIALGFHVEQDTFGSRSVAIK